MQAVQETAGEVQGLQVAEDAQEQPGPYPIEKLQVGRRSPGPRAAHAAPAARVPARACSRRSSGWPLQT